MNNSITNNIFKQLYACTLTVLFCMTPILSFGNQWLEKNSESLFNPKWDVQFTDSKLDQNAEIVFDKYIPALKHPDAELKLMHDIVSPSGRHLTFIQTWRGTPIYGSQLKANLSKSGEILSLFNKTIKVDQWENEPSYDNMYPAPLQFTEWEVLERRKLIFPVNNHPVPAMGYMLHNPESTESVERIFGPNGEVLFERDLHAYDNHEDTLADVYAKVFLPNPISSADTVYGGAFQNHDGRDTAALNNERYKVQMQVFKTDSDSFFLVGPFVKIADFSPPNTERTYSVDSFFYFRRAEDAFKEVNAYYHIHEYQKYIQSLGFENLVNFPIEVDALALSGQDNSRYSFATQRIYLGTGGVPDAEDADVILHEYTHAIAHSAAPNTRSGHERLALEEGIGDYIACSYARHLQPDRWEDLFNWDGHNPFWSGRWCVTSKYYPTDMTFFSIYQDGEIWIGAVMDINRKIGRETTDILMLNTLYSLSGNMTMDDAAKIFLQNDSLLNNFEHEQEIRTTFQQYGFLGGDGTNIVDQKETDDPCSDLRFTSVENHSTYLRISLPVALTGQLEIYDLTGRKVASQNFEQSNSVEVSRFTHKNGIFIFSFTGNNCIKRQKIFLPAD